MLKPLYAMIQSISNENQYHEARQIIYNQKSLGMITKQQYLFLITRLFHKMYENDIVIKSSYNPYFYIGFYHLHNLEVKRTGIGYFVNYIERMN